MNTKKNKSDQLYSNIIELIRGNYFKVGDTIFTENEAAQRFNISRLTVRNAYKRLEREGYLRSRPRIGTTLISKSPPSRASVASVGVKRRVSSIELLLPDDEIKKILKLKNGDHAYKITRCGGQDTETHETWIVDIGKINKDLIETDGLYNTLNQRGLQITNFLESIKSIDGNKVQRRRVGFNNSMPVEYTFIEYDVKDFDILIDCKM